MKNPNIVFIGMDTHKEHSCISYLLDGYGQEPVYITKVDNQPTNISMIIVEHD